jgi:hypothetical protein
MGRTQSSNRGEKEFIKITGGKEATRKTMILVGG